MNKKSIGQFIAVLRKARGMTQQEMADKLGVSNKAVSRWERDECAPDLSVIPAIAEMFDVTCDELLKGEKSSQEEPQSKGNTKVEKQVKILIKNTLSKYKNMMLIALGIAICGYIFMLGISYGFYRPEIGFPVMLLFEVAAVIVAIIFINKTKELRNDNDIFEKIEEREINNYNKILGNYGFLVIFSAIAVIVLSAPLVINKSEFVNSVLTAESYLPYVIFLSLILGALFFLLKKPTEGLINGTKTGSLGKERKVLIIMNLIQMGSLILYMLCRVLEAYLSEEWEIIWQAWTAGMLLFLVINVVAFVVFIVKFKEYRKRLICPGIRNLLLIIPISMVLNSFVVIYSDTVNVYTDSKTIAGAILLGVAIFVIDRIAQIFIDFKRK